jgi:glycosyltransferase involved in cell wall biosynthesis
MKIALIWKNDYPWDVRVEKIANSLHEAGHDVYLLCGNKKQLKREEVIDGINVIRLPCTHNRFMNSLISLPFHFNPFWLKMAGETVSHKGIELVIVRDLPLVSIGIFLKKRFGIPLILDMAENYPAMYWDRTRKGGWTAIKNWFLKNPYLAEYTERRAMEACDHIFVVVEESAQRLIANGVDSANISIVSNTPDMRNFVNDSSTGEHKQVQVVFVGLIQERGLDIVVKSLGRIRDIGIPVKFLVIGEGHYLNQLKLIAKQYQVEHMVEFKGWVKNPTIPAYIHESDIGVIPHKKNPHSDTTIPNKLFDYMACSKPVIVSNAVPLKRIVEEERCGLVFSAGSVESFTDALKQMLLNPAAAVEMGRNGAVAVRRRYNWSYDSAVLKRVVAVFATRGAGIN